MAEHRGQTIKTQIDWLKDPVVFAQKVQDGNTTEWSCTGLQNTAKHEKNTFFSRSGGHCAKCLWLKVGWCLQKHAAEWFRIRAQNMKT